MSYEPFKRLVFNLIEAIFERRLLRTRISASLVLKQRCKLLSLFHTLPAAGVIDEQCR
jgi:hypothetical protein